MDFSTEMLLESIMRRRLQASRAYHIRTNLLAMKLLQRYDMLHSANCTSPKQYRQTLLNRLSFILPLSNRPERVTNGHLIIPEE